MPEVKWVHPTNLYGFNPNSVGRVTGHAPVLTLDDLVTWLKGQRDATYECSWAETIDDLLAQVQAMRGDKP